MTACEWTTACLFNSPLDERTHAKNLTVDSVPRSVTLDAGSGREISAICHGTGVRRGVFYPRILVLRMGRFQAAVSYLYAKISLPPSPAFKNPGTPYTLAGTRRHKVHVAALPHDTPRREPTYPQIRRTHTVTQGTVDHMTHASSVTPGVENLTGNAMDGRRRLLSIVRLVGK